MAATLPPVWLTCPKCGERWQSSGKARSAIRCPNFDTCRGATHVPRDRPRDLAEAARQAEIAAALAADLAPGWDDEEPPAGWRDMLGPEISHPLATCAGSECECSGPRFRYTADHTGTVCPECGPECWQPSMDAYRRGAEHAKATAPRKPGTALGLSPAAADEQARAFARQRANLLRSVERAVATPRITADCRTDLEWFADAIRSADTPGRVDQLAAELAGYTIERDGWWRGSVELDDWTGDDDDQADDDAPELPEPAAPRELPAAGFRPVPGVLYGPGGVVVSVPAGISAAGMAQLREWNRRASGL